MDSKPFINSDMSGPALAQGNAGRPASVRPVPPVAKLDTAILEALPMDSQIISVTRHGDTHWSTGLRVDTRTQNGDKSYFVKCFVLDYVEAMRGRDAELMALAKDFIQKVAVRLLRPLQTGGRNIKPSLCHGDLWDGNIQIDTNTGEPVIFDPCVFYGHHEMDFQCKEAQDTLLGIGSSSFTRNKLALRSRSRILMTELHYTPSKDEMRRLLDKYPDGIGGFLGSLEPTITRQVEYMTVIPATVVNVGPACAAQERDGLPKKLKPGFLAPLRTAIFEDGRNDGNRKK